MRRGSGTRSPERRLVRFLFVETATNEAAGIDKTEAEKMKAETTRRAEPSSSSGSMLTSDR